MALTVEILLQPRLTGKEDWRFTIDGSPKAQLLSMGFPSRLHTLVTTGKLISGREISPSKALEHLVEASNAGVKMVVLSGPPGTGKSVAAALYLAAPLVAFEGGEEYFAGRWVSAAEYCNMAPWGPESQSIRKAERVALDDAGLEEDRNAPRIEELISSFYDRDNTLTITTNLALGQFSKRYGERTLQRIQEAGMFRTLSTRLRPTTRNIAQKAPDRPAAPVSENDGTKTPHKAQNGSEAALAAKRVVQELTQKVKTP